MKPISQTNFEKRRNYAGEKYIANSMIINKIIFFIMEHLKDTDRIPDGNNDV